MQKKTVYVSEACYWADKAKCISSQSHLTRTYLLAITLDRNLNLQYVKGNVFCKSLMETRHAVLFGMPVIICVIIETRFTCL